MSDHQTTEECYGCEHPGTVIADQVRPDDDLPLCAPHWGWWIENYLGADDVPCGAHLIGYGKEPRR